MSDNETDETDSDSDPSPTATGRPCGCGARGRHRAECTLAGQGRAPSSPGPRAVVAKKAAPIELPPQIVRIVSDFPLDTSAFLAARFLERKIDYAEHERAMCGVAMSEWLKTLDFELAPGYALILAYGMAFGSAFSRSTPIVKDANGDGQTSAGNQQNVTA